MVERGMGHYMYEKNWEAYHEIWNSEKESYVFGLADRVIGSWDWTLLDFKPRELSPAQKRFLNKPDLAESEDDNEPEKTEDSQ